MQYSRRLLTVLSLAVACATISPCTLAAQGHPKQSTELLALKRATKLYEPRAGALVATRDLAVPALFVASAQRQFGASNNSVSYRFVRPVRPGDGVSGWVADKDLDRPPLRTSEPNALLGNSDHLDLPEVIRLQKNPALKQAWEEIRAALKENESLKQQLPEPYFARAEIWSAVNNYDAALRDYLTATRLARESGQDLASYSSYFEKLYEALDNWDRVPKAPTTGVQNKYHFLAQDHFSQGFSDFWRNDLKSAVRRFDNAVQLYPQNPVYWYYRSVAFKRLGDERRAQHDACFGAYVEKKGEGRYERDVARSFQRLQGDTRQWLERIRLGDFSHSVVEDAPRGGRVLNSAFVPGQH